MFKGIVEIKVCTPEFEEGNKLLSLCRHEAMRRGLHVNDFNSRNDGDDWIGMAQVVGWKWKLVKYVSDVSEMLDDLGAYDTKVEFYGLV